MGHRENEAASRHVYVPDPARAIACGPPLRDEDGLGPLTLPGFLRSVVTEFAPREALVEHREDGTVVRWSYADLLEQSLAVAKALTGANLGKGERVGILMTNRPEFLAAVFGTAIAGGVAAPLSTFSTPDELAHILSASACSVLLMERQVLRKDFASDLCELDPAIAKGAAGKLQSQRFPFLRLIAALDIKDPRGAIEAWPAFLARGCNVAESVVRAREATVLPADPGVLFFSSGSTAKPKGILSAHRGVSIQLWRMGQQQRLDDGVRSWTANGFFWSGNFAMVVGGTLSRGGAMVLQRTFQPAEAIDLMEQERATFLFAWPHQWEQLVTAPNWSGADLSALVHVDRNGPIARHPSINTDWLEPAYCYGNTETFTLSTGYPANTPQDVAQGSHGLPFPGNVVRIVDPVSGETLPCGEEGEIAIKGPTLMLGYLGIPLDRTLDDEGYFRTGDGGHIDAEGRLFWKGRLNDIIKTGGANVSPLEIDEAIRALPAVKLSQTVGLPHETLGEIVVSCLVLHEGETRDEAAVRTALKQRLASYKVPRRVLFLDEDELETTGSAKIKTAQLRTLALQRLEADD